MNSITAVLIWWPSVVERAAEPYNLKISDRLGVPLGESLKQYLAIRLRKSSFIEHCDHPSDHDHEVNCIFITDVDSTKQPTVGEYRIDQCMATFYDQQLVSVTYMLDGHDREALLGPLKEKFGPPKRSSIEISGKKWITWTWKNVVSSLQLEIHPTLSSLILRLDGKWNELLKQEDADKRGI